MRFANRCREQVSSSVLSSVWLCWTVCRFSARPFCCRLSIISAARGKSENPSRKRNASVLEVSAQCLWLMLGSRVSKSMIWMPIPNKDDFSAWKLVAVRAQFRNGTFLWKRRLVPRTSELTMRCKREPKLKIFAREEALISTEISFCRNLHSWRVVSFRERSFWGSSWRWKLNVITTCNSNEQPVLGRWNITCLIWYFRLAKSLPVLDQAMKAAFKGDDEELAYLRAMRYMKAYLTVQANQQYVDNQVCGTPMAWVYAKVLNPGFVLLGVGR